MTTLDSTPITRPLHPWVAEGQQKIRLGVLAQTHASWPEMFDDLARIEQLGYDSIWVYDHPMAFGSSECWLTLAAYAAKSTTIRLGSAVSCIYYRHPAILARIAADIDRLSNGRLILGLGIGDLPEEFARLNIPYASVRERQAALEETIHILQRLWTEESVTFTGKHFSVQEANCYPPPLQQPHIPLLIAGGGERVTLRQVAQYADVCNFGPHEWTGSAFQLADTERKYAALHTHCTNLGRDYNTVLRSYFVPQVLIARTQADLDHKLSNYIIQEVNPSGRIFGLVDEVTARFQTLVDLGAQYFIFFAPHNDHETLQILVEEIIPSLQIPVLT